MNNNECIITDSVDDEITFNLKAPAPSNVNQKPFKKVSIVILKFQKTTFTFKMVGRRLCQANTKETAKSVSTQTTKKPLNREAETI